MTEYNPDACSCYNCNDYTCPERTTEPKECDKVTAQEPEERPEYVKPVVQPEYKRQRCKDCGSWYTSGKHRLDTGYCEPCAKSNGAYVQTRRAV